MLGLLCCYRPAASAYASGGRRVEPPPAVRLDPHMLCWLQVVQQKGGKKSAAQVKLSMACCPSQMLNAGASTSGPLPEGKGKGKDALVGFCLSCLFPFYSSSSRARRNEATHPYFKPTKPEVRSSTAGAACSGDWWAAGAAAPPRPGRAFWSPSGGLLEGGNAGWQG